jgi:protein-tyrosine kinase
MGKFFEAIRKSEPVKNPVSGEPQTGFGEEKKIVRISPEKEDGLRLDAAPEKAPSEHGDSAQGQMDPRLMLFLEPQKEHRSMGREVFKILRANILTRKASKGPHCIMVTSPQAFDGKSVVAANLAVAISQGVNEPVVLVDCDLRCPSLGKLFGLDPYLRKTPVRNLTLLSAGEPTTSPSRVLSSEKMRTLVAGLKDRCENGYIVFDASPAQFRPETAFLASMVDAVVLVVRARKTGKEHVLEAIDNIGRNRILGLVFDFLAE